MSEPSMEPTMAQLRRFLYLGDESKLYPDSISYPFTSERIQSIFDIAGSEEDGIREITRVYRDGHYLGLEPIIYALAVFAHSKQLAVKHSAFKATREICLTATAMISFTHFYKELCKPAKGWGRAHRKFVNCWYNGKDAIDLAAEVTKVKSRYKWTHKDILCLAHVKADNPGLAAVFKYTHKGYEAAEKEFSSEASADPALKYLKATHDLNCAQDAETAARLIEAHDLCLDQIPSKLLKTKEVSLCLISRVPIKNLLNLVPLFCKLGFLKLNTPHYKALLERLGSEEALNDSSMDPLETFLAIRKWQLSNRLLPGKPTVRQNTPAIDDALKNVHVASFKSVIPTQKRYLVALDIRPYMSQSACGGCKSVTPSNVSEIVLLALVKAELSNVTVLVFSPEELVQVDINNKMTISDVNEHLNKVESGPVNLCSVTQWALTKKKPFDLFLVMTDTFVGTYKEGWTEAFKEYRDTLHLPNTRFLVNSLTDTLIKAPHEDQNIVNITGFNIKLLKIIQDFTCGKF